MGRAINIIRSSINAFFHSYHSFASAAAVLVFPVSAAILLSQVACPSSSPVLRTICSRLRALFEAAGLPASAQFFSFLNLKLSQTILSFFTTLPFTLTFLIAAKVSIFQIIAHQQRRLATHHHHHHHVSSLYSTLLLTHLFNSFIILSANAAVFSLLFLAFNGMDILRLTSDNSVLVLSAAGAVLYSVVLTNALVVCSLSVVVSAMEGLAGHLPFLRACVLIRGREATAIALALPVNLGMAATEALFQHRVVRPYRGSRVVQTSVVWEAFSIVYMYSILVVLDVIVSLKLYESCKSGAWPSWEERCDHESEMEPEEKGAMQA